MLSAILSALRIIFGLVFLLFVPGYALTLALFPRKEEITLIERVGFAGVLSIVADILTTLFIDLVLGIPTTAINIVIALLCLTALALLIWRLELLFMKLLERRKLSKGS
ncbi:MAG: putative membrane protein [Candidatus Alkanophagales archaeon MCA70_species_2]|nr:putative membrane protein [Candidatus Alkanophaga liquidiphilum]